MTVRSRCRSAASADCVGEWVLVHVGFAMSRLDEEEAARTLALLHELDEIQAEETAMRISAEAVT